MRPSAFPIVSRARGVFWAQQQWLPRARGDVRGPTQDHFRLSKLGVAEFPELFVRGRSHAGCFPSRPREESPDDFVQALKILKSQFYSFCCCCCFLGNLSPDVMASFFFFQQLLVPSAAVASRTIPRREKK